MGWREMLKFSFWENEKIYKNFLFHFLMCFIFNQNYQKHHKNISKEFSSPTHKNFFNKNYFQFIKALPQHFHQNWPFLK